MRAITGSSPGTYMNPAEQRLGRLRAELDFASTPEIMSRGLHEFLDDLQLELNLIGSELRDAIFALRPAAANGDGQVQTQTQLQTQR